MKPHVLIIGGGFAGLYAARRLANHDEVRVTVLDRQNYHLFQPLLYEVATAVLSPGDVATPIRHVLMHAHNTQVRMGEADRVDLKGRTVHLTDGAAITYDYLFLATGVRHSYFGNDTWEAYAPGLKTLDDALEIRRRVLSAFEQAEVETDPEKQRHLLTFTIVGAGPTGVELAGAISELARFTVSQEFRNFDPKLVRTVLVEAGPRILTAFDPMLSEKALLSLQRLGVEVMLNTRVESVGEEGVQLSTGFFPTRTVMWAAGVATEPFARTAGVPLDSVGRIIVNEDLTLPGHPEVVALGDLMNFQHGSMTEPLPPLAQVAIQSGQKAADNVLRQVRGLPPEKFSYFDKGIMATIGRAAGVVQSGPLKLWGFLGWLGWLFIHLLYLIGFRNRLFVFIQWAQAWFTYRRGIRLITGVTPVPEKQQRISGIRQAPPLQVQPAVPVPPAVAPAPVRADVH